MKTGSQKYSNKGITDEHNNGITEERKKGKRE